MKVNIESAVLQHLQSRPEGTGKHNIPFSKGEAYANGVVLRSISVSDLSRDLLHTHGQPGLLPKREDLTLVQPILRRWVQLQVERPDHLGKDEAHLGIRQILHFRSADCTNIEKKSQAHLP
jgi:hypothetical protein